MTAFALTGEQQDFAERVREIASGQLRALAEAGTPGQVNRELIKAMGDLGLLSRLFPGVSAGGLSRQAAALDLCILREALATQSTEAETALALQGLGSYPVLQSGQEEVVRRWLPAVAAGDAVAAFALTEPEAGVGRRRAGAAGRTRRPGMAADRREGVDLQRAGGRLLHRLRADHTRRGRARGERLRGARRPARPGR